MQAPPGQKSGHAYAGLFRWQRRSVVQLQAHWLLRRAFLKADRRKINAVQVNSDIFDFIQTNLERNCLARVNSKRVEVGQWFKAFVVGEPLGKERAREGGRVVGGHEGCSSEVSRFQTDVFLWFSILSSSSMHLESNVLT